MKTTQLRQEVTLELYGFRMLAALCSSGAGAIHLLLAQEHFQQWWGYGWFFLIVAAFQSLYSIGLMAPKARLFTLTSYLLAGISVNLWVVGLYFTSRIGGVPLWGPHAGHMEKVAPIGIFSTTLEMGTVAFLSALLLWRLGSRDTFVNRLKWAGIALLGVTATLLLLGALTQARDDGHDALVSGHASGAYQASATDAGIPSLPTFDELVPLLSRRGSGPRGTSADVLYAPPVFFQVSGEEIPRASLERPTLVFSLAEADHEHEAGLTPEPPPAILRLDGGASVQPYQVTVLLDGDIHRTSNYLFPMPEGTSLETLSQETHVLTFAILLESGGESVFTWQLPLELPEGVAPASVPDVVAATKVSGLTRLLTRTQEDIQYQGRKGIRLEATYATPAYFAAALPTDMAIRYAPDRFTVFLLTERLHTSELTGSPPDVALSLDQQRYKPDLVEELTRSPHHRASVVRFPTAPPDGTRHQVMELLLPGGTTLTWHLPTSYAGLGYDSPRNVTWGWLLAVLGGLVTAMWPCLFQLTVFFIPSLAGLSAREATSTVSLRRRASVMKAALLFVLGFTVVYTIAGAVIGAAAGRFEDTPGFDVWPRYLGIAGGIMIVFLALRVAAQVRAPFVCKMPVLSGMSHRRQPANALEMMIAGVAFATGCMTCFGAAAVVAMVVYVGLSGSALVGAFTLFLFSMGMGIPLVIAAIGMAKVLPLLSRFEQAVRWMGLASSLVMVGFAALLISGNYMVLTEWIYSAVPGLR